MIEYLDETIRQLLVTKVPLEPSEVDISFDMPDSEWSTAISKPTLNVYLCDIRENMELRMDEWATDRDRNGRITKTRRGQRIDLSYLITAWTASVEDEHRLLWYVLETLSRYPVLPEDVLPASLRDQPYPIHAKVAKPDTVLGNAADIWTALGNQLKPGLTYNVTLSLEPQVIGTVPEVRSALMRFAPFNTVATNEAAGYAQEKTGSASVFSASAENRLVQLGGRVTDAADAGKPIRGAEVVLVEQGLNVRTDVQGRFAFNGLKQRNAYTFLVVAAGYVTARTEIAAPAPSYDIALQPEGAK